MNEYLLISVLINIAGLVLLFIGNMLVTDSITRFDAKTSSKFKLGNRFQGVGFIISIIGLLLNVLQ